MVTTAINLFGGPGCGKSTTAAGPFYLMKCAGMRCELVTELAKELVYDGDTDALNDQLYILTEQEGRQQRLQGKVDYIITDSPLLLSWVYAKGGYKEPRFKNTVAEKFNHYNNLNYLISRVKPYQQYGRIESVSEAERKDKEVRAAIQAFQVPIRQCVRGDTYAPYAIFRDVTLLQALIQEKW